MPHCSCQKLRHPIIIGHTPNSSSEDASSLMVVKDLFLPGTKVWNAELIDQNFFPWEVEGIKSIPIGLHIEEDLLIWPRTPEEAAFSFLDFVQSRIPRGIGCDSSHWCLNGNGKFDIRSNYNKIWGASIPCFLWKGIWKVKVPRRVAFFMWTTIHGQILTLDNLMLWGLTLVNRCCMCNCNEESIDHLLLHFPVAHLLWVHMLQVFGIQWVMPSSLESLVFCWRYWQGKFNSNIWNMVPGCMFDVDSLDGKKSMIFEAKEKSLVQLQALCQSTLFDWSRC
ncbi:hypothetical protein SO802_023633 [Lithocarpus litseifolius]|uniref:Reverse transcriptase zinc-binding domain-containing protein n=1 Tax=Lithocarpus litseifolius TaxID=425828 RepID=A0AAW2CC58_9ROSI